MISTAYRFLPTWRWVLCLLVSLAVLFAAINYQKNALHWLAYACCSLLILGSIYSRWVAGQLAWEWRQPEHVFSNEAWTLSSNLAHIAGFFGAGDIKYAENEVKTDSVGLLSLNVSTWTTEYPLGLFRVRYSLPSTKPVWVYPQPVNHRKALETSTHEPELTNVREYQLGDRPKLLIKKTQALPIEHWQVRTHDDARVFQKSNASELSWAELPVHWTLLEKLQQLSYDIAQLSDTDNFTLVLPNGRLTRGHGIPHKHHAWKLLVQEWEHWS
jgi:hypothetical protein